VSGGKSGLEALLGGRFFARESRAHKRVVWVDLDSYEFGEITYGPINKAGMAQLSISIDVLRSVAVDYDPVTGKPITLQFKGAATAAVIPLDSALYEEASDAARGLIEHARRLVGRWHSRG